MFLSIKRIIAITLIVAITVTSAGTSTLASSVQNVTATAKTNYEKQETIDYRFYEAFKYQRRTSLLLNGDSQEPKLSGEVDKKNGDGDGATKTGADSEKETTTGSPAFSQKKDEENKETTIVESENDDKTTVDKSLATNSETTGDENDDEKTTINANEEEPEEDENVATSSDTEDDERGEKSNKTENEEDEEEKVATFSDVEEDEKGEKSNKTENEKDEEETVATSSDAEEEFCEPVAEGKIISGFHAFKLLRICHSYTEDALYLVRILICPMDRHNACSSLGHQDIRAFLSGCLRCLSGLFDDRVNITVSTVGFITEADSGTVNIAV